MTKAERERERAKKKNITSDIHTNTDTRAKEKKFDKNPVCCVSLGLGAWHRTNGKNFINFEAVVYRELHRPLHMTTFMTSNS